MAKVALRTLSRARALRRKLTNAEVILWSRLRREACGIRFRRQHPIGPYIADFACVRARIFIEVDGDTHSIDAERRYDARREAFMRNKGWHVIRVWNRDVYDCLDAVVDSICNSVKARLREPAPSTFSRPPSAIR